MDIKTISVAFVAIMVGAVAFGAMLPIFQDVTATEDTFTNEGYYTMDKIDNDTERVITWSRSTPDKITIDGVDFDMSFAETNKSYTLIGSESVILRYQVDSSVKGIQVYGSEYVGFHTGSAESAGTNLTITLSSGSFTYVTDGTSPLNKTFSVGTDAYVINPSTQGQYAFVMKKSNIPAYVLADSDIRFLGVSVTGGPNGIAIYGIGNVEDGMTLSTIYKPNTITTVTYTDPVVTDSEINGYVDLYTLDKYTFTITYDANTYDATYSYFLVPSEVTAEKSIHGDDGFNTIVDLIPLVIGMGLLLIAVWWFVVRKF